MKEDLLQIKRQLDEDRKIEKLVNKNFDTLGYVKNGILYTNSDEGEGRTKGILASKVKSLRGDVFGHTIVCLNVDGAKLGEYFTSDYELPEGCYFFHFKWFNSEEILDYVELKD